MRWSDRVEEALGMPAWSGDEANQILDLTRDVAHGTERRYAPLTAFALGVAVGQAVAAGTARSEALAIHVAALRQAAADAAEEADGGA
jgi:hypothetical protein